jgi:isoleucyl-tRNA synthetase
MPEADAIDPNLTAEMALVLKLVSLGHAARNKANRKLRQPLLEAAFYVPSSEEQEIVREYAGLIKEELNVKRVRLLDAASEAINYQLKALPKQLGQKYGSRFPAIRETIGGLDPEPTALTLLAGDPVEVQVDGETLSILPDEIEVRVEAQEGFEVTEEAGYVAALVTEITPELEQEGLAREFVRRVQELRKTADLEVDDRILLKYAASDRLQAAIDAHQEYIRTETIAVQLQAELEPSGEVSVEYKFDGEHLTIALSKA